jgi:hypothetical protein
VRSGSGGEAESHCLVREPASGGLPRLTLFLADAPRADDASARAELMQAATDHGERELFLGFVEGDLLRGELSQPQPDLEAAARGIMEQLAGAETLHVRGRAGTDLTIALAGCRRLTDACPLEPGGFGFVFSLPEIQAAGKRVQLP